MPETTEPQLTEPAVRHMEDRLRAWAKGEISQGTFPASWAEVDALIRDWRAMKAELEKTKQHSERLD